MLTVIYLRFVSVSVPLMLFTIKLTVYFPAVRYVWVTAGAVEYVPSPKSQILSVAFSDMSVNFTERGARP